MGVDFFAHTVALSYKDDVCAAWWQHYRCLSQAR